MGAGTEVILGMTTDPDFGPLVTLGLGGIFAEILRDSTALIPPFAPDQALRALQGLAGFALLTGARGRPPADLGALCRRTRGGRLAEARAAADDENPGAAERNRGHGATPTW